MKQSPTIHSGGFISGETLRTKVPESFAYMANTRRETLQLAGLQFPDLSYVGAVLEKAREVEMFVSSEPQAPISKLDAASRAASEAAEASTLGPDQFTWAA